MRLAGAAGRTVGCASGRQVLQVQNSIVVDMHHIGTAQAAVCSWHHPPVKLHWRMLSRPTGSVPAGVLQSDTKRGPSTDSRGAACCCHQLALCLTFRLML